MGKVANKNDLNGCLAHGARLEPEALRLVNKSENLVIGIAPLQRLSKNVDRLAQELAHYDPATYLTFLKDNVDNEKILFDLDYSWNRDFPSNEPIINVCQIVRDVFKENATNIF